MSLFPRIPVLKRYFRLGDLANALVAIGWPDCAVPVLPMRLWVREDWLKSTFPL